MDEIIKWSCEHYMKINPDKTEILLLGPPTLNNEVIINGILYREQGEQGEQGVFSDKVKNVGVYIDNNMNMDKHVNTVVSHCYKILKDIWRIKRFLSRQRLEQLIHAIISHRLDYCNSVLINISKENINSKKFKMLQRGSSLGDGDTSLQGKL